MTRRPRPPKHNRNFPPRFLTASGGMLPQMPPGPADGETPEAYAARLMVMGYQAHDARRLAGLDPA